MQDDNIALSPFERHRRQLMLGAAAAGLVDRGHLDIGARGDLIRVARVAGAAALRGVWVQGKRVG